MIARVLRAFLPHLRVLDRCSISWYVDDLNSLIFLRSSFSRVRRRASCLLCFRSSRSRVSISRIRLMRYFSSIARLYEMAGPFVKDERDEVFIQGLPLLLRPTVTYLTDPSEITPVTSCSKRESAFTSAGFVSAGFVSTGFCASGVGSTTLVTFLALTILIYF